MYDLLKLHAAVGEMYIAENLFHDEVIDGIKKEPFTDQ